MWVFFHHCHELSLAPAEKELTEKATVSTWNGTIVSPYFMLASSDAKHWCKICDKVYRFSPLTLSQQERATVHGNDERIPKSTVAKNVEFFVRLIKNR